MSLRVTGRFHELKIPVKKMTKELDAAIFQTMKEALAEWLMEVLTKVPVYTGMSVGSLQPVARFVGETIMITPKAGSERYPKKNPEAGADLTTINWNNDGRNHYFTIDIGTIHYMINEFHFTNFPFNPASNAGPWHSFQAGREVYRKYLKEHLLKRCPEITKYIARTEVKDLSEFGGNTDE